MEVWGFEAFNNDAAVAWLNQLRARGAAQVHATIDAALGPRKLSAEEGAQVVAAVAIVAGIHDVQFAQRLPRLACDWTQRRELAVDADWLRACAAALTTAVAEGSALSSLWRERGELDGWRRYIAELQSALGIAPLPQTAGTVPAAVGRNLGRPFNPRWSLASPLQLLVAITGALLVIAALFGAIDILLLGELPESVIPEELPVTFPGFVSSMAMLFYFPIQLAAIVFFFIWVYRTHVNLQRLGSFGLGYSPGWSVGSFFIPFINLYRPLNVVQDAYRASDPQPPGSEPAAWMHGRPNYMVVVWWALLVVAEILYSIYDASLGEEAVAAVLVWWHDIGLWLAFAVDSALMVLIVKSIQERQTARGALLARAAAVQGLGTEQYVFGLAESFFRQYPDGKVPPAQRLPPPAPAPRPSDRAPAQQRPVPSPQARPPAAAPAVGSARTWLYPDRLRREKFIYIGAWLAYIVGLCFYFAYSNDPDNEVGIIFAIFWTIFYLIGLARTFFADQHAEKWTCFGLVVLLVATAAACLIGFHGYRDPVILVLYLVFFALHGWLLSILIRDAQRWRNKPH